jgi:hypothetical protein
MANIEILTTRGRSFLVQEVEIIGRHSFWFKGQQPFVDNHAKSYGLTYSSVAEVQLHVPESELSEMQVKLLEALDSVAPQPFSKKGEA